MLATISRPVVAPFLAETQLGRAALVHIVKRRRRRRPGTGGRIDGAVRVLADTYHMDIEEDDPCASLWAGAGHVPFEAIDGWAETA
jgi:hypothetical protein